MSSIFKKFCAPAIIYLVFSMVHTLVAVGRNDNSGALLQLSLGILVTLLLQLLCMKGMNIISWIIVFLPFMFYTYIVIILYRVFGITVVYPKVYNNIEQNMYYKEDNTGDTEDNIGDTKDNIDHNHTNMPNRWVNSHSDGTHSHKNLPNKWK